MEIALQLQEMKTTTAMAGDFATLTNQGKIEVTGNKGIGIFGAGGSKVLNDNGASIKVGQEGVALFGTNKLGASTLGDKKISLENKGNITAVDGKKKLLECMHITILVLLELQIPK